MRRECSRGSFIYVYLLLRQYNNQNCIPSALLWLNCNAVTLTSHALVVNFTQMNGARYLSYPFKSSMQG